MKIQRFHDSNQFDGYDQFDSHTKSSFCPSCGQCPCHVTVVPAKWYYGQIPSPYSMLFISIINFSNVSRSDSITLYTMTEFNTTKKKQPHTQHAARSWQNLQFSYAPSWARYADVRSLSWPPTFPEWHFQYTRQLHSRPRWISADQPLSESPKCKC